MNKGVMDPEILVGAAGIYTYHLPPRAPGRGKGNTSKIVSQARKWQNLYMTTCKKISQKVESQTNRPHRKGDTYEYLRKSGRTRGTCRYQNHILGGGGQDGRNTHNGVKRKGTKRV